MKESIHHGLHERFHAARERSKYQPDDVKAGRTYVEAYVPDVHYVEQLWQAAAQGGGHEHGPHHAGHAQ